VRLNVSGSAPCSPANERDVELGARCAPSPLGVGRCLLSAVQRFSFSAFRSFPAPALPLFTLFSFQTSAFQISLRLWSPTTRLKKRISEFMRTYLLLRLYRLTLLLGTSGAVVTALASDNIRPSWRGRHINLKTGSARGKHRLRGDGFQRWWTLDSVAGSRERTRGSARLSKFSQSIPVEPIYGKRCWQLSAHLCRSPVVV